MPKTRVDVNTLIGASRSYVRAEVKKANLNGNNYLTVDEAKALPADLRDNFAALREPGKKVTVKQFEERFTAYVAKSARAADQNKDGVLTQTDAKKLPKDLRDNFLNFVTATQAPVAQPTNLTDRGRKALKDWVANVAFNTGNPEGEAFRTAIVDGRTPADKAALRGTFEAAAAAWDPAAPDWESTTDGTATTYFGRFADLYTELKFDGATAPSVYVEID